MGRETVIKCYPNQTFKCLNCEDGCCKNFEVQLTTQEADNILKLNIANTPKEFSKCFSLGAHGEYTICKDENKRCVFMEENICKIHKYYGVTNKPSSCRIFPFHIVCWEDEVISSELRFICPGVGFEGGKSVSERMDELKSYANMLGARRGINKVVYSHNNPVQLTKIRHIHAGYENILKKSEVPWKVRLYAVARILEFHKQKENFSVLENVDKSYPSEAVAFFDKVAMEMAKEVATGKYDSLIQAKYRNILCGYLRDDNPNECKIHHRIKRGITHLKVMANLSFLSEINPNAPKLMLSAFPSVGTRVKFTKEAMGVFEDFFYSKLDSMHFCGNKFHNFDYETGLSHLLLSVPIIFSIASGFCFAEELELCQRDNMLKAVRVVDFTFGRSPFFRMKTSKNWLRFLIKPARYAGLLNKTFNYRMEI